MTITYITKRDGRVVPFDAERIARALRLCFQGIGAQPRVPINELTSNAVNVLRARTNGTIPTVEDVQDIVEMVLQAAGEFDAAKHYILYRAEHARTREERPVPEDVRRAFAESDAYFPSPIQKFQFFDKYARFNYSLGRRETWVETVDRSVDFFYELAGSRLTAETYQHLRRMILEMLAMPSMRLLAMAGPAARRSNITIYNCSYLPVESIDSFVEALIISMSGCGVGYSVESHYVENFSRIRRQRGHPPQQHVVEDTAEGWAHALRLGLETWMDGGDITFDTSLVRPAGAPLRTKGGRASGPAPLQSMLQFVRNRILSRQGSYLRTIDAHDMMCAIGNAAVSGGMRRTAMLALFDSDDERMRQCKSGDFERENNQRWNANNSAVWPSAGLTQTAFIQHFVEMAESGRGEPGIFNRDAANTMRPPRRDWAMFGTNPCVTGDTWVLTRDGPRQVCALVGKPHITFVNNRMWATNPDLPLDGFFETGIKPVVRLITNAGYELRLTTNHRVQMAQTHEWRAVGSLAPGDAIKLMDHRGVRWEGSGSIHDGHEWASGGAISPPETRSYSFYIGYLRGMFDRCSVIHHSRAHGVWLTLILDTPDVVYAIQRMLLRIGIVSSVFKQHEGWYHLTVAGANIDTYLSEIGYSSRPRTEELRARFSSHIDCKPEAFSAIVKCIVPDGHEAVYDCSVPGPNCFSANGFVAHNCGEIVLRPYQFCNLSSAIARADDTVFTLTKKVEAATIIGTIQAMATDFPGLRPIWARNCQDERLLGVDITGQLDCPAVQHEDVFARLRMIAVETNQRYAEMLQINHAAAITCVKPSGNASELLGCAPGLHARWSPYYIRNVRVSAHSPIFRVLRSAGVPMSPENGQTVENATTWVVHFPVKAPEGAITRSGRSAMEQCAYWLRNKRHWTEHNPSCTITYRPDEVIELMQWVWDHRDEIGGLSFLPTFDAHYDQMPYVEISREEYEHRAASFPAIDWSKIYRFEQHDLTNAAQEVACSSGGCLWT